MFCPVLGANKRKIVNWSHQDGWGTGAFALRGKAEGKGLVQPEEEWKAKSGLPTPLRRLARRWS